MRNVYCEPFCIEQGYLFDIHEVSYEKDEPYSCFMHFHEVHEFIVFGDIEGEYFYNQGHSSLERNDIVFTPALEAHDFELTNQEKSWHIVQVLPEFFHNNDLAHCESLFKQGLHLRLPPEQLTNIQQQIKWLNTSYLANPQSEISRTLLKLLILWIAEHAAPVNKPNVKPLAQNHSSEKLMPAIKRFQQETATELTMIEAASLCHMSPSHFSRQFKKVFRSSFSEYQLRHKLYLAARLLSTANKQITQISYDLNFSSPSHFIAQFKRHFGTTPLQYQKDVATRART